MHALHKLMSIERSLSLPRTIMPKELRHGDRLKSHLLVTLCSIQWKVIIYNNIL